MIRIINNNISCNDIFYYFSNRLIFILKYLSLQVIEGGGDLDISFKIISPRGVMLVKDEKRTDEVHTVTTPHGGVYSFCFDNSFSTVAEKMVYVDLDLAAADEDSWFRTLDGSDIAGKELQMDSIRVCDNLTDCSCVLHLAVFCYLLFSSSFSLSSL